MNNPNLTVTSAQTIGHRITRPWKAAALLLTSWCMTACGAQSHTSPRFTPAANRSVPTALAALPVQPATTPASPASNPFADAAFYVDPHYTNKVENSAALAPHLSKQMAVVKQQPTALWLDRIAAVEQLPAWLENAQLQGQALGNPTVPVIVVYNLPNRDCAAKASNGELSVAEGGEQRYRSEYIDVIAEHLANAPSQKVAIVLEPD